MVGRVLDTASWRASPSLDTGEVTPDSRWDRPTVHPLWMICSIGCVPEQRAGTTQFWRVLSAGKLCDTANGGSLSGEGVWRGDCGVPG